MLGVESCYPCVYLREGAMSNSEKKEKEKDPEQSGSPEIPVILPPEKRDPRNNERVGEGYSGLH